MKSKKLKKLIAIALVSTTILAVMPIGVNAEWKKDYENNWNWLENGNKATGWKQINGIWYYFDNNGKMKTGWIQTPDLKWYYLNSDGSMKTGWMQDVNGKWYNLASSGAMRTGWMQESNGTWYFADESGAMQTGVIEVEGKTYVLSETGAMLSGNIVIGDKTYTADQSGAIIGDKLPAPEKAFTNEGVVIEKEHNGTSDIEAANNADTKTTNNEDTETTSSTDNSSSSSGSSRRRHSSHNSSIVPTDSEKLIAAKTVIEGLNLTFDTDLETTISKANAAIGTAILPTGVTAKATEGTGTNAGKVVITITSGSITDETIVIAMGDIFENGEGDNTYKTARTIKTDGTAQSHSIYPAGDEDWVKFSAVAGKNYEILTSNMSENINPFILLYNTDGTSVIGAFGNNGGELKPYFHCLKTGTYYAMISSRNVHKKNIEYNREEDIKYGRGEGDYDISIKEGETAGELESIVVATESTEFTDSAKTEYIVGEPLDIRNLIVGGYYNDNTVAYIGITPENITGFDISKPADSQTLTITVDGKTASYEIKVIAESSAARITSTMGEVNDAQGYIENIPYGTTLEAFKGAITPLGGGTFKVYDYNTRNEATSLTRDCYVEVTSKDGTNSKCYDMYILQNTDATLTSKIGTVDNNASTITIPKGTTVDDLYNAITPAEGAEYWIYNGSDQADDEATITFNYTVIVTAEDGISDKAYKIIVDGLKAGDARALNDKIAEAITAENGKIEGDKVGNQIVGSKAILDKAIGEAQGVYDEKEAKTQGELDAVTAKLDVAITKYKNSVIVVGNASALNDKIAEAKAAESGKTEGTNRGDQFVGSKDILDEAIGEAQKVYDVKETKNQEAIDEATTKLDEAIKKYNNSVVKNVIFSIEDPGNKASQTVISGSIKGLRLDYSNMYNYFVNGTIIIEFPKEITVTTSDKVAPFIGGWRFIDSSEISDDHHKLKFKDINLNACNGDFAIQLFDKDMPEPGTYTITVNADFDGEGSAYTAESYTVTLISKAGTTNHAPTIANNIPDSMNTTTGAAVTVDVSDTFTDEDKDPLTISANIGDLDVATVSVIDKIITITPLKPGSTTITVTADDGKGGTVPYTFPINVSDTDSL